jgi:hypothetical protein
LGFNNQEINQGYSDEIEQSKKLNDSGSDSDSENSLENNSCDSLK